MALQELIGQYGFVAKIDVSNLSNSTEWYTTKLQLTIDEQFSTPTWAQLNMGTQGVAIGLNLDATSVGTQGATLTFVVSNITVARDALILQGVQVGPIQGVGDGVQLAFFADPDGNQLALRQNSSDISASFVL